MKETNRSIPGATLAAVSVVVGGLYTFGTWAVSQLNGRQEKLERNDSAYVVSYRAEAKSDKLQWRERRDSARISVIEKKLKIQ